MKVAIALMCFFALAAAIDDHQVPIVSRIFEESPDGKFHYSYETGDGVKAEQTGELKAFDKDHVVAVVQGRFLYPGDDGQAYSLSYTADENGFHPDAAHLPVAPPVPEAIQRALAWIAAHPSPISKDEKRF